MNASQFSHQFTSTNTKLLQMSKSAGEAGPSGVKGDGIDSEFSRIEELIRANTFTREEISTLLEILNSRAEELEKNTASRTDVVYGQQVTSMLEIDRTPFMDKPKDLDRFMPGTSREKRDVLAGVAASPIDLARAYMAGRTADQSRDPYSLTLKGERSLMSNNIASNPVVQSPPAKSSICWPGAMVQDHRGYATPQSQKGRSGIRDFPRTPYSRTNMSKSTTKLRADSRFPNTSTPFQPSRTSIFGQARMSETVGGGSVGPIRRMRNKYATEIRPRGSIFQNSPKGSSEKGKPNEVRGFLPNAENIMELGETSGSSKNYSTGNVIGSSDRGYQNSVKKILEHLDRHKPTPKEKEEELMMVTSWRSSSTTGASSTSLLNIGGFSSSKSNGISGEKFPAELPKSSSFLNSQGNIQGQEVSEANDRSNNIVAKASGSLLADSSRTPRSNALPTFGLEGNSDPTSNNIAKASGSIFADSISRAPGLNSLPTFGLKGNSDPTVNNLGQNPFRATNNGPQESSVSFAIHVNNGPDARPIAGPTGADPSKTHGTKPSLSSISVSRTFARPVSSDNGPGFSFPVSASVGVLSEPPTPSMIPSSTSCTLPEPEGVPSYSFGTNKSTPPLVFSFPSTSNAAPSEEASDLNFTFGSDEKSRLSFSSFGNDTICY